MTIGRIAIIFLNSVVGWGLCGAIIFIGRSVTSMNTTLILHAIGAPIIFSAVSYVYYKFFHYTTPLQTALFFTIFVIVLDVFISALLIEKSFEMFASLIGTWIPFALIYISTYVTGWALAKASAP
jgi:hypothetical protein